MSLPDAICLHVSCPSCNMPVDRPPGEPLNQCVGWNIAPDGYVLGVSLIGNPESDRKSSHQKTLPHKRRRVRDREQGWWTAMCAPVREYPIRGDLQPAKKLSRSTYSPKKLASSLPKVIRSTTALLHIINVS